MGPMQVHNFKDKQACLISREAMPIRRHRNPVGIFSRALIYPLIGFGAWRHRLELVVAGAALEALLWTAMPPVEETFGFIEDTIDTELDWLNAPPSPQKNLSFVLLALFPISVFASLWRRSWRLLAASAGLIVGFYVLMHHVAGIRSSLSKGRGVHPAHRSKVRSAAAPDRERPRDRGGCCGRGQAQG